LTDRSRCSSSTYSVVRCRVGPRPTTNFERTLLARAYGTARIESHMRITGRFGQEGGGRPIEEGFFDDNGSQVDGTAAFFPIIDMVESGPWLPIGTGFFISNNGLLLQPNTSCSTIKDESRRDWQASNSYVPTRESSCDRRKRLQFTRKRMSPSDSCSTASLRRAGRKGQQILRTVT
jgi:hypothetical protein